MSPFQMGCGGLLNQTQNSYPSYRAVKWTDQYDMNDLKLESPFNINHTRKVRFMAQRYQREYTQFNGFNGFVWRRQHININFVWIAKRSVGELAKDRMKRKKTTQCREEGGSGMKCTFCHYHISVDFPLSHKCHLLFDGICIKLFELHLRICARKSCDLIIIIHI